MNMTMTVSITEFLTDYKSATNKDQEALAISKALEKLHAEQECKIQGTHKELLTKKAFQQEMKLYATKDNLNNAKWQVIGVVLSAFFFTILIPVLFKHFGV